MTHANDNLQSKNRSGSQKRQRRFRIVIACTETEDAAIVARADEAGMSVASFARACMLGIPGPRAQRKPHVNALELAKATGALNRIGNNLNQVAYWCNANRSVALGDCLAAIAETRAAVAAILDIVGRRSRDDRKGNPAR